MGGLYSCFFKEEDPNRSKNAASNKAKEVDQKDITVLKLKAVQDRLLAQKKGLSKNVDKAQDEAKMHIANKKKEQAMFALKRKKLYETYLTDVENQYAIVQKSIIEVESAIMTAQFVEVLQDTNDMIKEIESAGHLEKLREIGDDIKEREQQTREFNKLFEENHIEDVDDLYAEFEMQVNDEDQLKEKPKPQTQKVVQPQVHTDVQQQKQEEQQQEEEEDEEERTNKLLALA